MGAWIEIFARMHRESTKTVAPLVGAWIEITFNLTVILTKFVAPLVGAWIEIRKINSIIIFI